MKIIGVDNFARDNVSDILIAENVQNKEFAEVMQRALNDKYCNHENASTYYVIREDDYKLFKWEP